MTKGMATNRLVIRFDRLPAEMRLGDSMMVQGFKWRRNFPPDEMRCKAAVIIGLNPRHFGKNQPALLVGSAYRCPMKIYEGHFCWWHMNGPKSAIGVDAVKRGRASSSNDTRSGSS